MNPEQAVAYLRAFGSGPFQQIASLIERLAQDAKPTVQQLFAEPVVPITASLPSLHFTIPTPPSSKNTQQLRVIYGRNGKPVPTRYRPKEVMVATEQIQEAACEALRLQAPTCYRARTPLLSDEDAQVEMVHNVQNESVDVVVRGIGARPKGRTGRRRDVVNLPELVLDAMQGIAFGNDNQVADLRVWRNVGVPSTDRGASC